MHNESACKEEVKSHFVAREGVYKVVQLAEYTRPTRFPHNGQGNYPVRISFITARSNSPDGNERICYNIGRELFFYNYRGVNEAPDLTRPIDKRTYKGTCPTCHDINWLRGSNESLLLLVGFSQGQVQLIDPVRKEISRLFNEERTIDKSKVTCIKWVPAVENHFLVSHASGHMYVYNQDLEHCPPLPPIYQAFKSGDGFTVQTCKAKSTRNPLYKWTIGDAANPPAVYQFSFSPCSKYLAVVGQDGYLRVFDYNEMELVGKMRSYFGGLLCVCWSPDGKYVATGGEDDLVTVWSFHENRVVCRGFGHQSWINQIAFDTHTSQFAENDFDDPVGAAALNGRLVAHSTSGTFGAASTPPYANICGGGSDEDLPRASVVSDILSAAQRSVSFDNSYVSYRFGSVGQDTQFCLWDLTEDVLTQYVPRSRTGTLHCNSTSSVPPYNHTTAPPNQNSSAAVGGSTKHPPPSVRSSHSSLQSTKYGQGSAAAGQGQGQTTSSIGSNSTVIATGGGGTGSDKSSQDGGYSSSVTNSHSGSMGGTLKKKFGNLSLTKHKKQGSVGSDKLNIHSHSNSSSKSKHNQQQGSID